jgi:hypothetical protein
MNKYFTGFIPAGITIAGLALAGGSAIAAEEWDEFVPIIEINATDGDVGFHVLLDGEGWEIAKIYGPDNKQLMRARAKSALKDQGATEFFMESAEPPCWFDEEDEEADEDDVVTVEDFLERFPSGTYRAAGKTIEGDKLRSTAELTHDLPAAPMTDVEVLGSSVTISWSTGTDLGECEYPETIADPAEVEVVRWEIVLEPNEDELPGGELPEGVEKSVFMVQLPATASSVVVPAEFVDHYLAVGVNQFKYEVGAREESGNQTFTEEEFEIDM